MPANPLSRIFRLAAREPSVGQDVDLEVATHLEQQTDLLVSKGWERDAAREEARRRFGDLDRFRRELRAIDRSARRRRRIGDYLDGWRQDLKVAGRGLSRSPGYAAVVIGTLGLALGANATMFGVVDRLLLQPPPGIAAPDEVRRIDVARWMDDRFTEPWDAISYPSFEGLRDRTESFAQVAVTTGDVLSFGLGRDARPARALFASGQYFALLGTRPALGRFFTETDDAPPGRSAVVVLGNGFWRDAMGADPQVVGRTIVLNGQPYQVIGVAPPHFNGTDLAPNDLWLPLASIQWLQNGGSPEWRTGFGWQWLNALVRLKRGVSDERALTDATRGYQQANQSFQPFESRAKVEFRSLRAYSRGPGIERVGSWLYGVTLVVLLIASANIANVVLARGIVRRSETAVRQALGISPRLLLRQLLVETALVLSLGLALGLAIARWGGLLVRRLLLAGTTFDTDPVNPRVLLATAAAALLAGILASLWPLIRSARVDPAAQLHGAGRSTGKIGARARTGLLLVQTTLCTSLVIMAGLFLKSVETVRTLDLGIDPARASLVSVNLSGLDVKSDEITRFYQRAAERIRALPGVAAAGITFCAPFQCNSGGRIKVPGKDSIPRLEGGGPYYFALGPGALEAFGVRLLQGRTFTAADRRGSPPVAIVSESMARTIWPGESALGKCFIVGADSMPCREVIGITADVHRQDLDEKPFLLYWSVLEQERNLTPQYLVVRSAPGAGSLVEGIRRALLAERSDLPYVRIDSYHDILARYRRPWDLGASLLTVFGALSLVIAAIGLAGVVAFGISQRTREIGLRAALGATPGRILRAVLAGGVATSALGVALGIGLALLAGPRLEALLFRTRAADPSIFATAAALVVIVSAFAAWLPGRRATKVDPITALRSE